MYSTNDEKELYHYGVLGMKWGVRRNRQKAIDKSFKKLSRLDSQATKANARYVKAHGKTVSGVSKKYTREDLKAKKAQVKADKKKYGLFANPEKAAELQAKADAARSKADKYKARSEKRRTEAEYHKSQSEHASNKAKNWAEKMSKNIGEMTMSELSSEQISLGKKYLDLKVKMINDPFKNVDEVDEYGRVVRTRMRV